MNPLELPPAMLVLWWGIIGLLVGSFLNVVIHRYPYEQETITRPRRSRCPKCRHELRWYENLPLISWLIQAGRCRGCRWPIPVRYPLVEALNAGLWAWIAWRCLPGEWPLALVWSLAASSLLVTTFVDFDHLEIPDWVSIGGMCAAPVLSWLVPQLHSGGLCIEWVDGVVAQPPSRLAAAVNSLAGIALGGGILWIIGIVGGKVFGKDAMGFGDVKLLGAGGGLVGPVGALAALMVASLIGSVMGVGNVLRWLCFLRRRVARRGSRRAWGHSWRAARVFGQYLPFGPALAIGIFVALCEWDRLAAWWPVP